MIRIATVLFAGTVLAVAPWAPASAAETCALPAAVSATNLSCKCDDEGCLCVQVEYQGDKYGPCML